MSFLNLGLGQLISLIGMVSAGVVALYLLDRSKRRQVVATLRFWTSADVRTEFKRRHRIQQPWSLLLQLISLALLLLAVAGPRWGGQKTLPRDHVLLLDTSAWMGARTRNGTLMDDAKTAARAYVRSLPGADRVMIVRADALATPATRFESNRQVLDNAINDSQPGGSQLNLTQALEFAARAQKLQSPRPGEIVFAGAGRVPEEEASLAAIPANLRVLPVAAAPENVGLRKIGLRRSPSAPDTWEIYVAVRNYGARPQAVDLALQFGGAPAGSRRIALKAGAEEQASFTYRTAAAGYLEARIRPVQGIGDAFPQDDRALIELPATRPLHVIVYSAEPESLRALVASQAQISADFEAPSKYDPQAKADVLVLDRFAPSVRPHADSIWIQPPSGGSPIPVKATRSGVKLERWRPETVLGAGLRTEDVQLETAEIFTAAPGDIPVAESGEGPLVLARPGTPKMAFIGFHPLRSSMKYELATPLLMANILRWMAPETFRRWEVQAGTVGTVNVTLDPGTDPANVRVLAEDQRALPFTMEGNTLRFFSGASGTVRVLVGDRELVYSLTLPDVGEAIWHPPAAVRRGIPRGSGQPIAATDAWPWLALLGGLGLLTDWLLFGRNRARAFRAASAAQPKPSWRKAS